MGVDYEKELDEEEASQCSPVWKTGTIKYLVTECRTLYFVSMRLIHRGVLVFLS